MATKYAGRGLVLDIEGQDIASVLTGLDDVGSERNLFDQSAYGDDWADWGVGQQDGTEVTMTIAYDPVDTQHLALIAAYEAGTPTTFGLTHAEAGWGCQFEARVRRLTRGGPRDGNLTMNVALKIVNPGVTEGS